MTTHAFIPAVAGVMALAVASPPAVPQSTVPETDMTEMVEQIEVMRLVIARAINRRFAELVKERWPDATSSAQEEEGKAAANAAGRLLGALTQSGRVDATSDLATSLKLLGRTRNVYQYSGQYTSHTRGYYASGLGAMFMTETVTPTVRVDAEAEADAGEPNEWSETLREVRRGRSTVTQVRQPGPRAKIDPQFIEAAIDAVIDVLGRHGLKLDGLDDGEALIVAIRFNPGMTLHQAAGTGLQISTAFSAYNLAVRGSLAQPPTAAHAVIQISRADVVAFREGRINRARLDERAVVDRY